MLTKGKIAQMAKEKAKLTTKDVAEVFGVSRQYVNVLIGELVADKALIKLGSTRSSYYVRPEYAEKHPEIFPVKYTKTFKNVGLEEHKILMAIENAFPLLVRISENIRSIFTFAFSEMLNNAIEHSQSKVIHIEVSLHDKLLSFTVSDSGVGVFRNIMQKKGLQSELEAVQDLLKGKTTTMPKSHSGEGIFFTSKVGDMFLLDSFGNQLLVDNMVHDVFVTKAKRTKRGTTVSFKLSITSKLHLSDVFKKYTNIDDESDFGFDKTEVRIKLYTAAGVHISRSQARRVLSGLEKFKVVVFDYDKVPVVGQAFADEIYRVFMHRHPKIKLEEINMNEGVQFMIERAKNEAKNEK